MAQRPAGRGSRRANRAGFESDERRGWLSHGLAALGISALGLAIAGSLSLTTSAQPLPLPEPTAPGAPAITAGGQVSGPAQDGPADVGAFVARGATAEVDTGRATLRTAVLREQAAQRAEELARAADEITRAGYAAAGDARQNKLTEADRASARAAAQLADERLRRAIEARVAAASDRESAESNDPAPAPDLGSIPTGGGSASPVPGAVIGSRFGQYGVWSRYHTGIDFRASYGTPIRSVQAGVVVFAGNSGDWAGNHVAIRHGDGKTTMSSHMSSMAVRSGQTVSAGQVIGYVGETGRAFGAHLHFELYPVGVRHGDVYRAINPQPWLNAIGVRTN